MTDNISFDPYLSWVDTTDPDNLPADAKLITAADLLRYENFGVAATAAVNGLITDIATTNGNVEANAAAITAQAGDIADLSTSISNLNSAAQEWWVVKATNELKNNTTAFAADAALKVTLPPSRMYFVEVGIYFQTSVTADIRLYLAGSGISGRWATASAMDDATVTNGAGMLRPNAKSMFDGTHWAAIGGSGVPEFFMVKGIIMTGASTNKLLSFNWAQSNAEVSDTYVLSQSYMHVRDIGTY